MTGNRTRNHQRRHSSPRQCHYVLSLLIAWVLIGFICFHYFGVTTVVQDSVFFTHVYHSPEVFKLNYGAMEREFKVFVYQDGDEHTYYHTPRKLTGKFASEGYFFKNIRESQFFTTDPDKAHLFFIPISCHKMRAKVNTYEMTTIVEEYVQRLILKYPYWNRTLGADHFFVTCHDIGVRATEGVPLLVKNSIRVVCSASYNAGYIPHKDVALPQVLQPITFPTNRKNDIENRTTLGFWAGQRSSEVRVKLASAWENDTELDIQNNQIDKRTKGFLLNKMKSYRAKFCVCPSSSQVNSGRIADSIHYGCVPDGSDWENQ